LFHSSSASGEGLEQSDLPAAFKDYVSTMSLTEIVPDWITEADIELKKLNTAWAKAFKVKPVQRRTPSAPYAGAAHVSIPVQIKE
jgi:hypothetical protein